MYEYEKERENVFTEYGAKHLINIYKNIRSSPNGMITVWGALKTETGNSFHHLACLDFLVEMGEVKIADAGGMTQDNIVVLQKSELS